MLIDWPKCATAHNRCERLHEQLFDHVIGALLEE
jgi:hypothetical protein